MVVVVAGAVAAAAEGEVVDAVSAGRACRIGGSRAMPLIADPEASLIISGAASISRAVTSLQSRSE